MADLGNRQIIARNILHYMKNKGVDRQKLCSDLGFKYTTFSEWVQGGAYPRIDKIQKMADYFGCTKSDLIEDKSEISESESIGERIKKRRIELEMSQEELAAILGFNSRSSINKIEISERELPLKKIKAIADALETTPGYIMGWEKDNSNYINADVQALINAYKGFSVENKKRLNDYIEVLSALERSKK